MQHKIKIEMDILEILYNDEVVQYIADRHKRTPQEIIDSFLPTEDGLLSAELEDNEQAIIRDLIRQHKMQQEQHGKQNNNL